MTQYITNFTEYTSDVQPSDWTERWTEAGDNVSWITRDYKHTSGGNYVGPKFMYGDRTATDRWLCSWDQLDGIADLECLSLAVPQVGTGNGVGILLRGVGAAPNESGYLVVWSSDNLYLGKYVNGTWTTLDGPYSFTLFNDEWVYLRFRVDGTDLSAKIWKVRDAEPGAWDLEASDSDIAAGGWNGVTTETVDTTVDYFSADDTPATAPSPPTSWWDDDFTGGNGDPPNAAKWSVATGSPDIQSNALEMSTASGVEKVDLLGVVSGDFDIQIDLEGITFPSTNSWRIGLRAQIDGSHYTVVNMCYYIGGKYWFVESDLGAGPVYRNDARTNDTANRLRLTRSDTDTRQYYDDGGADWVAIDNGTITLMGTGDVTISLETARWDGNPTAVGQFDNFRIMEGAAAPASTSTTTTETESTSTSTTSTTSSFSTTSTTTTESYSTNFGEYTSDLAPSDWTENWALPVSAVTVKDSGQYGAKYLLVDHSTFGHYFVEWDDLGTQQEVEALAKVQLADAAPAAGQDYFRLVLRQTGGDGNKNAYELRLYPNDDQIKVYKWVTNAESQVGPTRAKTLNSTAWYWARFQVRGSAIKAKVWSGQPSDEPGAWDIETTDSDNAAAGTAGVGSYEGDDTRLDWYSLGVGPTSAPTPADFATTSTSTSTSTSTTTTGTTESLMEDPWDISLGAMHTAQTV